MDIYDIGWALGERHACKLVSWVDSNVDGGIYLTILRCPGRGAGSRCLSSFIATFRRLGFRRIRLDAYPMGYRLGDAPPDQVGRLVAWYERFGFRLSHPFRPDTYNEMVLGLRPTKGRVPRRDGGWRLTAGRYPAGPAGPSRYRQRRAR